MRVAALLALFTLSAVLAGCVSNDADPPLVTDRPNVPLALDQIVVPDGAELVEDPLGAVLEWADVTLPFRETIVVADGADIIRVEATMGSDVAVRTYLQNEDSGRRRCNPDIVQTAWNVGYTGTHTCSGMTAIDPPGTNWTVQVTGGLQTAKLVRVIYEDIALDGPVSKLDLSQLSMPTHELLPTDGFYVPSFDDTPLWTEVTLPDGEGPWPTIIAASPYNGQYGRLKDGGAPAMWEYWTQDWAKRGYATVNVDVRGFGLSGGCVEIWGINEQLDQKFIVDWVADQEWSDGNVGFYGQSYVGTTPTAAAVHTPDALKAIIAVAPVINAYEDWHHGGVPNGENYGSVAAYQVLTDVPSTNPDHLTAAGPLGLIENEAKGVCDPTIAAKANDPRAIYDAYYEERDFKLKAQDVEAAVLFTEGFEDANVKSAMIPGWFNELQSPKLGIFGHWVHQHPTRADEEILFLGWMDQYVKGRDVGFEKLPNALIATNAGTQRGAESWPTAGLPQMQLWPDYTAGTFSANESDKGGATLHIAPAGLDGTTTALEVAYEVTEPFAITGVPQLNVRGTLESKGNAFLYATLYDEHDGQRDLISYGAYNLAHDATHKSWTPVTGTSDVLIEFLPTEYEFQEGHKLVIVLSGAVDPGAAPGLGLVAGEFTLGAHPDGVGAFIADRVPLELYEPLSRTAME